MQILRATPCFLSRRTGTPKTIHRRCYPRELKRSWKSAACAALAGTAVFVGACRKPAPIDAPSPQSVYVDSALCADCHAEIAKTYRQTGMGRSLYVLRDANRVEDYTARNTLFHRASNST